jgi:hypothetical protein
MSVLSVPLKNGYAMQKDIFRFAATLFSESSDVYSSLEAQFQLIKCVFVKNDNNYLTTNEIADELLNIYKYHVSLDEIERSIQKHRKTFQSAEIDEQKHFKLLDSVFDETVESQETTIDTYIQQYIEYAEVADSEKCSDAIYKYLYELTTTNINSYRVLLYGKSDEKFKDSELSVDVSYLDEEELNYVHNFISWDNAEKNIALSNIVFTCLEYCMLINGDKPNRLLIDSIRRREIYLDTNILFRAIGINGPSRKRVVIAFLKKCKQARLKLIISYNTVKEFNETIDYYVNQISTFPRGNIFSGAFESYSDYNLFSFYEDWRKEHANLSLKYFKIHINSLYALLVSEYGIVNNEKIPDDIFRSDEYKGKVDSYSRSIRNKKQELRAVEFSEDYYYSHNDKHDASVVSYVEYLRDHQDTEKDIFFVSSDKILRYWDMERPGRKYPVVIYPSQLFLILIKTCGRSENDFDSFVSFINVRTPHQQINAEKANVILSAISSITQDIKTQKIVASAVFDGEYQDVIRSSVADEEFYKKVQGITKSYLDERIKEKDSEILNLQAKTLNNQNEIASLLTEKTEKQTEIELLKNEVAQNDTIIDDKENVIQKQSANLEKQREQICVLAEKQIMPKYIIKRYILPIISVLMMLFVLLFIFLQFFFKNANWNFSIHFMEWVKTTWFGSSNGDSVYYVDAAFLGVAGLLMKWWYKNPFNKTKNEEFKSKMVEEYLKKHNLDEVE